MTIDVLNYTYDVLRQYNGFLKTPEDGEKCHFLGMELETAVHGQSGIDNAVSRKIRQQIVDAMPQFLIFKSDASVPAGGFEMVTVPASYRYHVRMWERFFAQKCEEKLTSWDTMRCGIHVHIGRDTLTPMMLSKLNVFFNSPKNQTFLFHFAGRTAEQMNQWCSPKARPSVGDWFKNPHNLGEAVKYRALNMSKGPTVEIRIFRGNVKESGVMRNLDFVDAVLEFVSKAGLNFMNAHTFVEFVTKQPDKWKWLRMWLMAVGYIEIDPALGLSQTQMIEIYDGGR